MVPLIVRAMETLQALGEIKEETRILIQGGMPDRLLWLAMRRVAVMTTDKITFDLDTGQKA